MRLLLLSLVSACTITVAVAQEEIKMAYFHGGTFNVRFTLESTLLGSSGGRSAGMAGILSSIRPDAYGAVQHPAALGWMTSRQLYTEMLPPITINPGDFADLDGTIESTLDENLAEYDIPRESLQYPDLELNVGQPSSLGSGGAVLPLAHGALGFAIYRPLGMQMNLVGGGFRTMIETNKEIGDNVTIVQFGAQLNAQAQLRVNSTAIAASYGRELIPGLAAGLGLEWMQARVTLNSMLRVDGIMLLRQEGSTQGLEYVFNDPFDESIRFSEGEQNNLDQWANGSYRGTGIGARLSLAYRLARGWTLEAAYRRSPSLNLSGNFEFVQNLVPALNAETLLSSSDEEIFDVTNLSLAKPTLTRRVLNPTDSELRLSFPSSFTLGTSVSWGRAAFVTNASFYSGEISYRFADYRQGLKPSFEFRFATEMPFPWFLSPETMILEALGTSTRPSIQLGVGLLAGSEIKSGFGYQNSDNDKTSPSLFLPSFSLGKSFHLVDDIEAGLLLFSLPSTVMKIALSYDFSE